MGALRFLQSGVQSNWWGFGCPLHCGHTTWGTLIAFYLAGLISGWISLILVALWIFGASILRGQPVVEPTVVPSRLARYLHEPSRSRR